MWDDSRAVESSQWRGAKEEKGEKKANCSISNPTSPVLKSQVHPEQSNNSLS